MEKNQINPSTKLRVDAERSRSIKNFILNLFFPKFCFGCQKEGSYLCQDCKSLLEISGFHQTFQTINLNDLYWAVEYKNPLIKKLIKCFKYEPLVKELSIPLSSLIIDHFQQIENFPDFFYPVRDRRSSNGAEFLLIPLPLAKKKLKWRGFNPAEEIAIELSKFLQIPLISDCLIKRKETLPQVELSIKERKENILDAFSIQEKRKIEGRKILLVDDVYTTGSTMEEAGRVLKEAGAKEIVGIVIARAAPGQDRSNV